jgi:hypothetical protein
VAEPARRSERQENVPTYDPRAVERAYVAHRRQRRARISRLKARRHAGLRFFFVMLLLLALCIFLALVAWREIQQLFGL